MPEAVDRRDGWIRLVDPDHGGVVDEVPEAQLHAVGSATHDSDGRLTNRSPNTEGRAGRDGTAVTDDRVGDRVGEG